MNIAIVFADKTYARMLELSLTEKGANCDVLSPEAVTPETEADFVLLDAGCLDDARPNLPSGVSVILIGTEKQVRAMREDDLVSFFLLSRPFRMESLYGVIFNGSSETADRDTERSHFGIVMDGIKRCVYVCGEQVYLSKREYELFALLMQNRGKAVSRAEAGEIFAGDETEQRSNVVDVYIKYLREKIDERFDIKLIKTVRGTGYMIQ